MATGLLGGTFDPIHHGHLRLAEEMAEALGLDHVRFMPAGRPPHRAPPVASIEARRAMARLAIEGNPAFVLDERELIRPAPSYMVESLAELREELGPDQPLILLLGADAFAGLTGWHRWSSLFELAHLAVAHRPGHAEQAWPQRLAAELRAELKTRVTTQSVALTQSPAGRILVQPVTQLDISASRLREAACRGSSLRYLTPELVIEYIHHHQLYR